MDEKVFNQVVDVAQSSLTVIDQAANKRAVESDRINSNESLSDQGKGELLTGIDSRYTESVKAARGALPSLEDALKLLDREEKAVEKAAGFEPSDLEGWQAANAHALFVREDCERMVDEEPGGVVSAFRNALNDGDTLQIYLLGRYGSQALKKAGAARSLAQLEGLMKSAKAARIDRASLDKLGNQRAALLELRRKLQAVHTPANYEKIRQRFHI